MGARNGSAVATIGGAVNDGVEALAQSGTKTVDFVTGTASKAADFGLGTAGKIAEFATDLSAKGNTLSGNLVGMSINLAVVSLVAFGVGKLFGWL